VWNRTRTLVEETLIQLIGTCSREDRRKEGVSGNGKGEEGDDDFDVPSSRLQFESR